MADCLLLQPNLLTIVPGSINIENFIPGRIYKETLTIYNTCKIPIIVNLRASDKNKLLLNKSLLRIEVNDSKKVNLVIQDKINYSSKKLPTTPKKLYIYIKGELIDEKYEINLMYFCNNNTFKRKENNTEKEIPSAYLANYLNQPITDSRGKRRLYIDKTCNIFIRRYEIDLVASLKNKINILSSQISKMQKNGGKININFSKNFSKSNNSFFIMGNKLEDPKDQFKIDNELEKNTILAKNKILMLENSILADKIKIMEEKLAKIGVDENFEEKIELENFNYENEQNNANNYYKNNLNNVDNFDNENKNEFYNNNDYDNNEYDEEEYNNYQDI